MRLFMLTVLVVCNVTLINAQTLEDLLRITKNPNQYSARATGIGSSFMGISDEISALYYNPAGLSRLCYSEFSTSINMNRNSSSTQYLQNSLGGNVNAIDFTNIGFGSIINTRRKDSIALVTGFAINYTQEDDYSNRYSFNGFNPFNTITQSLTNETSNFSNNYAYQLYLADTVNGKIMSPIKDSVQQNGWVEETGAKRSLNIGIGLDLNRSFAVGLSVGLSWGDYNYFRNFVEEDINNKYNSLDRVNFTNTDFTRLTLHDSLAQSFNGFTARIGFLYKLRDIARIGMTITLPKLYTVTENFSRSSTSVFDNGQSYSFTSSGRNEYNVTTPWIFAMGVSTSVFGLILSSNVEYADYSQLSSGYATSNLISINQQIPLVLGEQITYGIGAEYTFSDFDIPISIRGGFTHIGNQYKVAEFDNGQNVFSGGIGILLDDDVRLDLTTRTSAITGSYAMYGDGFNSSYSLKNTLSTYALQITVRY